MTRSLVFYPFGCRRIASMASKLDLPPAEKRFDFAELSIAVVLGLAMTLTALLLCVIPFSGNLAGGRDFVCFWATGYQLVHHADPYSLREMEPLEHSAGLGPKGALLMRNPPWALPLVYPLGYVGIRLASVAWTLLLLACLLISVWIVRQMHGAPGNLIHWLGASFSPALICLVMGQTSLLALLGLALFLRYHSSRPFAAGAALWLCALKPQLFVPFSMVLLAWIIVTRSYKIIAGAAVALVLSSLIATVIRPVAWSDYIRLMRSPSVEDEFIPCLSDAIRFWIKPQAIWLQYLPAALCCVWALVFFWRRRDVWNWTEHGSLLMLLSLLAAPYSWFYDQCVAIPALLHGAYLTRYRWMLTILAVLIVLVDVEMCKVHVLSPLYLWNVPVWLAWYIIARATAVKDAAPQPAASA